MICSFFRKYLIYLQMRLFSSGSDHIVFTVLAFVLTVPCASYAGSASALYTIKSVSVIRSYPHSKDAFTQGLVFYNGNLYEGTGLYGRSSLRKIDLRTGRVEKIHDLPRDLFGEGITVLNDLIYQLTWKAMTGIIYDIEDFNIVGYFDYPFEGWGITNDGKSLIISNGTDRLFFYDPVSLEQTRVITVSYNGRAVNLLNELEYINGKIYANIWKSNKIISVDPGTGKVINWYDLSNLHYMVKAGGKVGVLNGIAFDKQKGRIFVTGKLWPKVFEIKLLDSR